MLGAILAVLLIFVVLFIVSRKRRIQVLAGSLINSSVVFFISSLFSLLSLLITLGTIFNWLGVWSVLFTRILPLTLLFFSFFSELLLFQIISSHGQIRYPGFLAKFQPILLEEKYHQPEPFKKVWLPYLLIVFIPILITFFFVLLQQHSLFDFHPAGVDEINYFQEIATFTHTGFNGGYFSIDELIAKSDFSHFGPHGPIFAILYGSLGKLLGWQRSSGPIFNLISISIAFVLFLLITRPNKKQAILLIFLTSLYYPLIYYIPSIMQESLNHSFAILLGGFLIRLSREDQCPGSIKVGAILTLTLSSLLRVTWIFAAFPIFLLLNKKNATRQKVFSLLLASLFSIVMALIYFYWTSAYPVGFINSLFAQNSIMEMVRQLVHHVRENILLYFRSEQITGLEIVFHYQYLIIMALFIINRNKNGSLAKAITFIIGIALVATILLYDVYDLRDFRTLAPFLLIGVLSLAFFSDKGFLRWFLRIYLLVCLLTAGVFHELYSPTIDSNFSDEKLVEPVISEIISGIQFKPESSPWCNSILASYPLYNEIRLLPPGIGINTLLTKTEDIDPKSHYVYVSKTIFEKNNLSLSCEPVYSSEDRVFCIKINDGCEQY